MVKREIILSCKDCDWTDRTDHDGDAYYKAQMHIGEDLTGRFPNRNHRIDVSEQFINRWADRND